jgi:CRISPR/Cas system-associated exonuclease Cas4 (RecB family)
MPKDKYSAVWISHSSSSDFLKCPRAYYLHNVYKDPRTRRKINVVSPALSLGSAVHETLEALKEIPRADRLTRDVLGDFELAWDKVRGKRGGFKDAQSERDLQERGRAMIERVQRHWGPIARKTVRLKQNEMLPNFYISEDEDLIVCGLIDWIEYVEGDDSVRIIDFKTGKHEEAQDSLQLPIYLLLLTHLQHRRVSGAAYWYLDRDDAPIEVPLPAVADAKEKVLTLARRIKAARESGEFHCTRGSAGCYACRPYEDILAGKAEYVGLDEYGKKDNYLL